MPDTFAHLGVQALTSRGLFKDADIRWIAVGCIIPDVPWIGQRLCLALHLPVDPFSLRFYAIVQASLFFCLLLTGALALMASEGRRIFLLLALNSFLHLFLDSLQIKWANGVHFFAPLCWQVTNFGLFWPEDTPSLLLTLLGVFVLAYFGAKDWRRKIGFAPSALRTGGALLLLVAYFALPPVFADGPRREDNNFLATLLDVQHRPHRYVEFDRLAFRARDNSILLLSGERLFLTGQIPAGDAIVSVQGRFADRSTIHVSALHVHTAMRDMSSKVALGGILFLWIAAIARKRHTVQLQPLP